MLRRRIRISPLNAAILLACTLAACGPAPSTPTGSPSPSAQPSASPTPAATPTPQASEDPSATPLSYALKLPAQLDAAMPLKISQLDAGGAVQSSFELSLASNASEVNLPRDRVGTGVSRLRIEAQPKGTCFHVQIETGFQPVGSGSTTDKDLTQPANWTALDTEGKADKASACVQGTVSDAQGAPLANALVLLGGTNPGSAPVLLRTNAQGAYRLGPQAFGGADANRQLELHAGLEGYRPQKQALKLSENPDWDPARNRYDFRLSQADQGLTALNFTLLAPSGKVALDLDYSQVLNVKALEVPALNEISPPLLSDLSITPAQLRQGRTFSFATLRQSQPYHLTLQENSCAKGTFDYYGLADQDNQLDTSNWTSLRLNPGCIEGFPLRVKVTDTLGRPLESVLVEYTFEEYNPLSLPPAQAPHSTRTGTTNSSGELITTQIPLYANGANLVSLRLIKPSYTALTTTYTVRKPNGDASVNQLTAQLILNR